MRILMIGDVVGRLGREAVHTLLPGLRDELELDLVVANGENAAGGFGLSLRTAEEMFASGVEGIMSGNHIWDQKVIIPHLDPDMKIARPLNYPPGTPGRGYIQLGDVLIVDLIGRVFVGNFDCPFRGMDALLEEMSGRVKSIVVDLHAEASSEKEAMGWYLDGRVSALVGTHTHIPTANANILPKGTAFVSDLGMVGPLHSIIGAEPEDALTRFLHQTLQRLRMVTKGPARFSSVLIKIDDSTGQARGISRVDRELD